MHHSPSWSRLVWIIVIGLVITGLLFYSLVQFWGGDGITRPGWIFLWLWSGVMLLATGGLGEYRRRQYRRDRRQQQREHQQTLEQQFALIQTLEQHVQHLKQALEQTGIAHQSVEQQLKAQTQQIQQAEQIIHQVEELRQERDRLTIQLQESHTQAQETERLFEDYCTDIERQNQRLNSQLEDLKHQNWKLTKYPNCPQPDDSSLSQLNGEGQGEDTNSPGYIPLSRLTNISGKQTVRALEKLGFTIESQTGSHIKLKRPHTLICIVPNHPEVSPPTLKNILQQADVAIADFLEVL